MTSGWYGTCSRVRQVETRIPVATYRAVVGLDVERSELVIASDLDPNVVREAILAEPDWCPIPWPQIAAPTEADLRRLALLKLQLLFDFANGRPSETSQEVREALWQRFPDLRASLDGEAEGVRFKRFPVRATVWSDGHADGGYEHPGEGEYPPIGVVTWDSLDRLIMNLARADLRDRRTGEDAESRPVSAA